MADKRVFPEERVDVILIRANQLSTPHAPLASELNTHGINVSPEIAWEGTTWPNNTDSNMVDDRSIKDSGNAQSRGYAQFEATLNFFHPKSVTDLVSLRGRVYQLLKGSSDRLDFYVVTRLLQTTPGKTDPVAEGDLLNVFRFTTDAISDDTEGEDSYKYAINFMPQGMLAIYTQAVGAIKTAITVTNPKGDVGALSVGDSTALRAVLNGKRYTNVVEWTSSDPLVATVSPNGVVTAVAAGTANITASHPAGLDSTATVVTVT